MSDDELLWAFGMVHSRAFVVDGIPRLVPFVDTLNHNSAGGGVGFVRSSSGATLPPSSSASAITATVAAASGTSANFVSSSNSGATARRGGLGLWEKDASANGVGANEEVTWSYKAAATPFDWLYLYGIVENSDGSNGKKR